MQITHGKYALHYITDFLLSYIWNGKRPIIIGAVFVVKVWIHNFVPKQRR